MKRKTKNLTALAVLCALAYTMAAVGRIPVVLFLKYDPKDMVIALGGMMFGPLAACVVSALVSVLEMATVGSTGLWGCVMNIISSCAFACTAAAIYHKRRTPAGAAAGLCAGALVMTGTMLLWNYLVAPLYLGWPRGEVAALLLPVFLPFNLLKGGLNAGGAFLIHRPLMAALRKAGYLSLTPPERTGRSPGLLLASGMAVLTCTFFLLTVNGVL